MKIIEKDQLSKGRYGEAELSIILNPFRNNQRNHKGILLEALCNKNEVLTEWQSIRSFLWQNYRTLETNKACRNYVLIVMMIIQTSLSYFQ